MIQAIFQMNELEDSLKFCDKIGRKHVDCGLQENFG